MIALLIHRETAWNLRIQRRGTGRAPELQEGRAGAFHRFRQRGAGCTESTFTTSHINYNDDSWCRIFTLMSFVRFFVCAAVILMATSMSSVLAGAEVYGHAGPSGLVTLAKVPTDEPATAVRRKARYHIGLTNLELEQAVSRAAQQHQVQPALLLAVMKAESSFNPTVVSKAGAVGLMQLIPETAIRHGVRNLLIRTRTSPVGPSTCATSWTGSMETSG